MSCPGSLGTHYNPGGGYLFNLDGTPAAAEIVESQPGSGDFVAANPDALAGEGAIVQEAELDESRQRLGRERARRVMAGQAPARQVAVRLRASAGGVRVAVYRDGVRFLHSIRYRD